MSKLDTSKIFDVQVCKSRFKGEDYIETAQYEDTTGDRDLTDYELYELNENPEYQDFKYNEVMEAWQ